MNNTKVFPNPCEFLPKQQEVIDAVKKFKYVLYSGAFGAGKTFLMCHVAIQTCINNSNVFGFFGAQTVPMLRDTVVRTFLSEMDIYQDVVSKAGINLKLEGSWRPSIMSYKFFNGSEIMFRSCDDPSKFKSLNLDFFILDEPVDISRDVFLMLQGRLRGKNIKTPDGGTHRFGAMAGNPAGKMNWVYQAFFDHPTEDYYKVHTITRDNIHLPQDYIDNLYRTYDFEYARRYLEGEWGSFIGLVYKDFDFDKHVMDVDVDSLDVRQYIAGVDIGFNNPTAMLAIAITRDNKAFIVDEYYEKEKTTDTTVEEMKSWMQKYKFSRIYVDPSAADWMQKADTQRLPVRDADNDINKGVAKIKSFFANDIIMINRGCVNLIKELESYQYDKSNIHGNETEKPMKKNDHCMDALRYGFTEFNPWRKTVFISGGSWNL
jgi:PBSX family phage terminase large subunit